MQSPKYMRQQHKKQKQKEQTNRKPQKQINTRNQAILAMGDRCTHEVQPLTSRFLAVIAEGGSPLVQIDGGLLGKDRVLSVS